jgi:hypothetical protein
MFNQPQAQGMNFSDFLGGLSDPMLLDKKDRVKYDENGNIIDPRSRRSLKDIRQNPYNLTPGNAIDPNVNFAQDVLAKGNKPFAQGNDLMNRYQQARGM